MKDLSCVLHFVLDMIHFLGMVHIYSEKSDPGEPRKKHHGPLYERGLRYAGVDSMQVFISRKDAEGKVTLGTIESREKEAKLFFFFFFFFVNNLLPFPAAYGEAQIILSSLRNEAGGFLGPKGSRTLLSHVAPSLSISALHLSATVHRETCAGLLRRPPVAAPARIN